MWTSIMSLFKTPAAVVSAEADMHEAERLMLKHEAEALYHTKMHEYHQETFCRLNQYLSVAKS